MSQGQYGEILRKTLEWQSLRHGEFELMCSAVNKLTIYNHDHPFEHQIQQFLPSLNNPAAMPTFV